MLGATLVVVPSASAAAPIAPIAIELEENIDDVCSSRSLLERLEKTGVATVRVPYGGTVALKIDVRKNGPEFDGVLTIRQGFTPSETRHATSQSCDEVFDALATIASIALVQMEPAPPPGGGASDGEPRIAKPSPPVPRRRHDAFHLHVGTGAELSLVGDGRGSVAIPLSLRLEHARMPTLRLLAMTRRTGRIVSQASAAEIDVHLGRFELGRRFPVTRRLSFLVAWSSEVGLASGRLRTGETLARAWWASGMSVYARLDAGSSDLELGVGAVLPVLRPRFYGEGQSPFFEVPFVVPWASLCGALSIF